MYSVDKPWNLDEKKLLNALQTSPSGLSNKEVAERLARIGPNRLAVDKSRNPFSIFLSQFKNPLVIILIVASATSLVIGDKFDATIILIILSVNSLIGFIQEYRSEKAVEALRKRLSLQARVIRAGKELLLSASELVPGDIVKISQGNIVPADIRLTAAKNLSIDESLVTGESFPVEKGDTPLSLKNPIPQDLKNLAFMGTNVIAGSALGLVYATGATTEFGKTAKSLEGVERETEFQTGVRKFGNFLAVLTIILVTFIFIVNVVLKPFLGQSISLLQALLFSLALAVGITPELLPFIITLNLSKAALEMSKKKVLVKRLIAVEDIGNADILCSDKTGTLTAGKIFLENYLNFEGKTDPKILLYGLLSSDETRSSINPLDKAIREFPGVKEIKDQGDAFSKVDELAFDFERKRNSVLTKKGGDFLIVSKGASEQILPLCSQVVIDGQTSLLLEETRRTLRQKYVQLSSQGYRLLAVAFKESARKNKLEVKDEQNLTFLGFLVFSDRPKETAAKTISDLEALNVQIKILTGDNEYVARHICQAVGVEVKNVITGESIDSFDDAELANRAVETTIFARITPNHKLRIIKALRSLGHTVAFLGDGANDAPALETADVGISVDTALDVAKEAADIILLNKSLEILVEAVKDGRRTFGNTMKYIYSTSSSNFGNIFSLAGASLLLPFIPLLPSQIILLNFVTDIPYLAIATDNVDDEYLKKPKHWNTGAISRFMIPFGLISSLFDFSTFFLLLYMSRALSDRIEIFRSGWFLESLVTEIIIVYLIRTSRNFWQSRPSALLIFLGAVSVVLGVILIYSPAAAFFGFGSLPAKILELIVVLLVAYGILVEVGKKIYYRINT